MSEHVGAFVQEINTGSDVVKVNSMLYETLKEKLGIREGIVYPLGMEMLKFS